MGKLLDRMMILSLMKTNRVVSISVCRKENGEGSKRTKDVSTVIPFPVCLIQRIPSPFFG